MSYTDTCHATAHRTLRTYCAWPAVLPNYILYEYMPLAVSLIYMSGLYGYCLFTVEGELPTGH